MSEAGEPQPIGISIYGYLVQPTLGITSTTYPTTQKQLELFGLNNTKYINKILAPIYCNTIADSIQYNGTGDSLQPIQTTINVQNGCIIQDMTNTNVLLSTVNFQNENGENQQVDFGQFIFMDNFNVVWSANAASVSGAPVQILIKKASDNGSILNTINLSWNKNTFNYIQQTNPDLTLNTDGQYNTAYLYADYNVKTYRIYYSVTLTGDIVSTFAQPLPHSGSGKNIYNASVFTAQFLGNLPTYIMVTQDVTVSYYQNARVTLQPVAS